MRQITIADLDELRGFGWNLWDPLGLDGIAPRDEYDTYLLRVVSLLRNGGGNKQAESYLEEIETRQMGLEESAGSARGALVSAIRGYLDRFPAGPLKFR